MHSRLWICVGLPAPATSVRTWKPTAFWPWSGSSNLNPDLPCYHCFSPGLWVRWLKEVGFIPFRNQLHAGKSLWSLTVLWLNLLSMLRLSHLSWKLRQPLKRTGPLKKNSTWLIRFSRPQAVWRHNLLYIFWYFLFWLILKVKESDSSEFWQRVLNLFKYQSDTTAFNRVLS